MTLLLVVGASAIGSYLVGRWWAVAMVPVTGLAVWLVIAATSGANLDTPVPFVTALATFASVAGLLARRRALPAR